MSLLIRSLNCCLSSYFYDDTSNINVYVGDDGLIHFVDKAGADTVLNFNKGVLYKSGRSFFGNSSSESTYIQTKTFQTGLSSIIAIQAHTQIGSGTNWGYPCNSAVISISGGSFTVKSTVPMNSGDVYCEWLAVG